jgi:hypothetical protein
VAAVAAVAAVLAVAQTAHAASKADQAAVAKVTNLNRQALDAYGKQDYDSARDLLKQALDVCNSAGLDQHPITARTHVHMGVVAIGGFKQRELGIKQFRKALEIEPDIKLTKSLVTPELEAAFDEAVAAAGGGATAAPADESAGPPGGAAATDAEAAGAASTEGGDEENRPSRPKPKPRRKHNDDEDETATESSAGAGHKGSLFFALTLGTSFGLVSGSAYEDPAHRLAGAGFAFGQLGQLKPEVGYFLNPKLLLSLAGRFQYVTGINSENRCGATGASACSPVTGAAAVLARATYVLTDGALRWTVGGQIGGGYVVHAELFPNARNCGAAANTQCVDAFVGGAFLIGPTAGVLYALTDSFDLVGGLNTELGAPKFTFNFDIDVGVALRL